MIHSTIETQTGIYFERAPLLSSIRQFGRHISSDHMEFIAQQIIVLLEHYYVHLPLKRSSLGIDPVQETRVLLDEVKFLPTDIDFYTRLFDIFKRLRDRHTTIRLPSPWRDMVAFMPFAIESCFDTDGRHLIISKVMSDLGDPNFMAGVEITHWNGIPIARYIEALSWETQGANPFARIAIALRSLTIRPLGYMSQPLEDWVTLTYRTLQNNYYSIVIPWRIYIPETNSAAGNANVTLSGSSAVVQGLDRNTLLVNNTWFDLYIKETSGNTYPINSFQLQDIIKTRVIRNNSGEWGYIRIFSFDVPDPFQFVAEMAAILKNMPPNGIIIDVRSNPGGSIPAGEGLINLFTSQTVSYEPVSFRNTTAAKRLGALPSFRAWQRSLDMQIETGDVFSQGFPLTIDSGLRGVYSGPVVIVIDALCYSTTDFFVAGMQDNNLATIIGVDPVTGAGGANVWTHSLLTGFVQQIGGQDVLPMSSNIDVEVALRRSTRVGPNARLPLEGLGVFADYVYQPTRQDVLGDNDGLITFAIDILAAQ